MNKNIYKRGNLIYIDARIKGKRHRFSSKLAYSEENLAYVKKHYKQILKEHCQGAQGEQKPKKESLLFAYFAQKYELHTQGLKASSQRTLTYILKELVSVFGHLPIASIKRDKIDSYLQQPHASSTIKRKRNVLKAIFTLAYEYEAIEKIPIFPKIKAHEGKEIIPFSLEEVKLLLDTAQGEFKNMLCVAFFTGMRSGELFALKWEDIDFNELNIRVNKTMARDGSLTPPKTKSSIRNVDMLPIVEQALHNQHAHKSDKSPYVFHHKGKPITGSNCFIDEWDRLLEVCQIKRRVFYNTRHSFASLMLQNNEEPLWVAAMMGHKNLNITYATYARYIVRKRITRASFITFNLRSDDDTL